MSRKKELLEKALNTYRQVITIEHFSYVIGDLSLFCSEVLNKDDWARDVIELFGSIDVFVQELRDLLNSQTKTPNKFKSKRVVDWIDVDFVNKNAVYFNRYMKYASTKGISINVLQTDVLNILNGCGDPNRSDSFLHKGLVYGEVQSGKTANYAGVINCAFDLGYKLVIVLAGITNKLRDQTESRLIESVTGRKNDYRLGVGEIDFKRELDRVRLISGDVSGNHYEALNNVVRDNDSLIFVVKKNPNSLNNLIKLIANLKGDSDQYMNSCLVIDDECDHASLRAMSSKEYNAYKENNSLGEFVNKDDILKAINARIRIILSLMHRSSYIGYTATPYSVVLQRSLDIERDYVIDDNLYKIDENTDLFPEDFITLIRPGKGYLGLSDAFSASHCIGNFIVDRHSSEHIESYEFYYQKYLEYLVQTYVLKYRNNISHLFLTENKLIREKFSIWMIHPDYRVDHINETAITVHKIHEVISEELTNLDKSKKLIKHLNEILKKFRNDSRKILGALSYDVDENMYIFPESIEKNILKKIIDKIEFVILHSSAERPAFPHLSDVDYESSDCPLTQIVIGGNILSRGTTFPGLVSTVLSREATRADSLYQMARWNGYRIGFEDILRVSMLESIAMNFKIVYRIDETLRRDLYSLKYEHVELRPEDWELSVLNLVRRYDSRKGTRSSFTLTGQERIRSAIKSNVSRSGHTIFLNDYSVGNISSNFSLTSNFIMDLNRSHESRYEVDYRKYVLGLSEEIYSRVFFNVDRNCIIDYLQNYESGAILKNTTFKEEYLSDDRVVYNVVIKSLKSAKSENDAIETLHYNIDLDIFEYMPVSVVGRSILKNFNNDDFVRITSILDSDRERHIDLINNSNRKSEFTKANPRDQKALMKRYREEDNSCLIILYLVNNSANEGEHIYTLDKNEVMAIPYVIMPKFKLGESVLIRN